MGDTAEMMLSGLLCATCGGVIDGKEPGYPRYCSDDCKPPGYDAPIKPKQLTEAQRNKRREKRRRYKANKRAREAEKTND